MSSTQVGCGEEGREVVVGDHQDRMLGRLAREQDRIGPRLVGLVGDAVEAGQIEHVPGQRRDDAVEAARLQRVQQAIEVAEPRQRARARRALADRS